MVLQYAGINLTDSQTQKVVAIAFSILGIIGLYSLIALFAAGDPGIREDKDRQAPAPAVNKTGALLSAPAIIAYLVVSVILIVAPRFGGSPMALSAEEYMRQALALGGAESAKKAKCRSERLLSGAAK